MKGKMQQIQEKITGYDSIPDALTEAQELYDQLCQMSRPIEIVARCQEYRDTHRGECDVFAGVSTFLFDAKQDTLYGRLGKKIATNTVLLAKTNTANALTFIGRNMHLGTCYYDIVMVIRHNRCEARKTMPYLVEISLKSGSRQYGIAYMGIYK